MKVLVLLPSNYQEEIEFLCYPKGNGVSPQTNCVSTRVLTGGAAG